MLIHTQNIILLFSHMIGWMLFFYINLNLQIEEIGAHSQVVISIIIATELFLITHE